MELSNLEVNTSIKFGKMVWIIKAKYNDINTVTLALKNSFRNMEFDADEPENPDEWISHYGNNNYFLSNVRQWLNADGKNWFKKQHPFDAPPSYADKKGFMAYFRKNELRCVIPKQGPGTDGISDFFYLPATKEKDLLSGDKFDRTWVWTSSPIPGNSCYTRIVSTSKTLSLAYACRSNFGVRPLCELKSGTKVKKENDIWTVVHKVN